MSRAATSEVKTRRILGVEIAVTDYERQLDLIDSMIDGRERGYFCHAAVGAVMNARRDPDVMAAINGATLTLPDGMPLVWALRSLGEDITQRVYGPDLMLATCEHSLATGARHFLYGGYDEGVTRALAGSLRERFPGLEVAGAHTPPFRPLRESERHDLVKQIDDTGADIVWVGTGSPRQELWMAEMRPHLRAAVLIGVGAAFDFHAGRVTQAPAWIGARGLEWLYRLYREPRRLGPRYLRDNPAFVIAFGRQWLRERS